MDKSINPGDAPPVSFTPALRRVGAAFVLYGLFDMGVLAFCLYHQINYQSSYNIFAVIAGILIYRGSLLVARFAAWTNAFFLGGVGVVVPLCASYVPGDLWEVVWRQYMLAASILCGYFAVTTSFLAWTQWRLTTPPVKDAYSKHVPRPFWKSRSTLAGLAVGVAMTTYVRSLLGGPAARQAIAQAQAETGPGHKYFITRIVRYDDTHYGADVVVYNETELNRIFVSGVLDGQ